MWLRVWVIPLDVYQDKLMNTVNMIPRIFADTNTFKWFSRDIQGDVIDFVQLVADVFQGSRVLSLETEILNRLKR